MKKIFFHNYVRYKREIRYRKNCTPDDVMNAQIKYYHTVKETMSCDCGEARLMSKMLKTALPCSHLFSLGVPFPEIQPPKIERINRTGGELFVEYKFIKSEEVKIDHDYYTGIRNHVNKQILYKKVSEIERNSEAVRSKS